MSTATAGGDARERAETTRQLRDLAAQLEAVDWRAVPKVSVYEAAAITARVDEARAAVEDTDDERDVST